LIADRPSSTCSAIAHETGATFEYHGHSTSLLWVIYGTYDDLPVPSIADVFFIAFYPFAVVGVVAQLRRDATGHARSMLLDGTISGLAVGAYVSWLAVGPVLSGVEARRSRSRPTLRSRPSTSSCSFWAAVAFSILGRRAGRHWLLILGSLVLQSGADTAYYVLSAYDRYTEGTLRRTKRMDVRTTRSHAWSRLGRRPR
jgi:hypothetical protein